MSKKAAYKEAVLWDKQGDKIKCSLCNWRCLISEGKTGHCFVRKNIDGVLYSLNYDKICAANTDPIEKKPLFHFLPGSKSFSIAAIGCNFQCEFCQNWHISQMVRDTGKMNGQSYSPQQVIDGALKTGCKSIAYTYTEPTIYMELCSDCGKLAKQNGLSNVFVSNGFMTPEAVDFSKDWLDAINIDLKAFTEDYYQKLCKAKLKPVLDTIKYITKNTNIWMEITTLIIPGQNDSHEELKQLADFIVDSAGPEVPWHISRFYPNYKFTSAEPTPPSTIDSAYEIGKSAGLHYIYVGNLPGNSAESTYCHKCGKCLIKRLGYRIASNEVKKDGSCPSCKTPVSGVWV